MIKQVLSQDQAGLSQAQSKLRADISAIEKAVGKLPNVVRCEDDYNHYPLRHGFADSCYVREITIPAGELVVGKIHRHCHPNFLMRGRVSVVTEQGGVEHLVAPKVMISPANTKRVVFTHTECVWATVHVTDKTDLDEIEEEVIMKDYKEETQCLGTS